MTRCVRLDWATAAAPGPCAFIREPARILRRNRKVRPVPGTSQFISCIASSPPSRIHLAVLRTLILADSRRAESPSRRASRRYKYLELVTHITTASEMSHCPLGESPRRMELRPRSVRGDQAGQLNHERLRSAVPGG